MLRGAVEATEAEEVTEEEGKVVRTGERGGGGEGSENNRYELELELELEL